MRLDGAVRGIRAAVFAGVCVVLALVGHVHASGAPVPPPVAVAAFAAVALGAWLCAGTDRRPVTVTLAALGTQAGLHVAFSAGQRAGTPRTGRPGRPERRRYRISPAPCCAVTARGHRCPPTGRRS